MGEPVPTTVRVMAESLEAVKLLGWVEIVGATATWAKAGRGEREGRQRRDAAAQSAREDAGERAAKVVSETVHAARERGRRRRRVRTITRGARSGVTRLCVKAVSGVVRREIAAAAPQHCVACRERFSDCAFPS